MVRITDEVIHEIIAHAREASPVEACGYLASSGGPLDEVIRMTNADASAEHYSFVPEEQFAALKKARAAEKELAAVYHSHPASPARMSDEDLRLAYDRSVVYVIVSLMDERPAVRAFHVGNEGAIEERIEIQERRDAMGAANLAYDAAEFKRVGMIQQKQKDFFAMRLHAVGGDFTSEQMRKVAEVAERFGRGQLHLSTRQGIEIHFVRMENLMEAKAELETVGVTMGACGPRVRIVVACPGNRTCKWGIIDTKEIAAYLDEKYFRSDTPHKFKMAVTGCPHNCAKASENDIGIMGALIPEWHADECIQCDLCVHACPTGAISREGDDYLLDAEKCINCSICTSNCPTSAWKNAKAGYLLWIGGTMGKIPRLASKLRGVIESKEELYRLVDRSIEYYRAHGKKRERFGHMIDRIGLDKVKEEILNG